MTSFSDLDPTSADDPRLDPSSDTARAARAAAIVRGDDARVTRDRAPRRRLVPALAATGAAATIALGVLLAGGSDGTPPDALAEAAGQTATARSGVVEVVSRVGGDEGFQLVGQQELRFDDTSLAASTVVDQGQGALTEHTETSDVVIGSDAWSKAGDGAWKAGEPNPALAGVLGDLDNRELADLVSGDPDAVRDGDTVRAELTKDQLETLPRAPLGIVLASENAERFTVELTTSDGVLRKVEVRTPNAIRSAEFSALGEPQAIEPPVGG